MELKLLKCHREHLIALSQIARDTFIAAFAHLNDPVDFQVYMEQAFSDETLGAELDNSDSEFYLVRNAADNVGYFKLNFEKAQTEIRDANSCELERIYVATPWQGKGIGEWMLTQAKEIAISRSKKYLWLGVWEKNKEAIRFYERHGFVPFGTHPYYIGTDKQTDWLMRMELVPS